MQHSASIDTIIEFTHRITSGISLFALIALAGVDVPGHCARDTWRDLLPLRRWFLC